MEAVLLIHTARIQSVTGMRRCMTVVPKGGSLELWQGVAVNLNEWGMILQR